MPLYVETLSAVEWLFHALGHYFLQHVNYLKRAMSHMVNRFMDTSGDLLVLDIRIIVDFTVVDLYPVILYKDSYLRSQIVIAMIMLKT